MMPPRESAPQNRAHDLAVRGLSFIAEDMDLLGRFLALSGFGPADLRARAADPDFLGGVLDFLLADETLVVAFAEWAEVDPASIAPIRQALPGGTVE